MWMWPRARTSQEANQLGGAVILPLIFLAVGQSSGPAFAAAARSAARNARAAFVLLAARTTAGKG